MSGFKLTTVSLGPYGRGFAIKFANDYVVSVQFGSKNVCSVKNEGEEDIISLLNLDELVSDAEVAVLDPDGKPVMFSSSDDTLHPFTTPEKLVSILTWAMRRKENDPKK